MSRMIRAFFASFFAPVALAFMPGSETAPQKANNLNAVSICQHFLQSAPSFAGTTWRSTQEHGCLLAGA